MGPWVTEGTSVERSRLAEAQIVVLLVGWNSPFCGYRCSVTVGNRWRFEAR